MQLRVEANLKDVVIVRGEGKLSLAGLLLPVDGMSPRVCNLWMRKEGEGRRRKGSTGMRTRVGKERCGTDVGMMGLAVGMGRSGTRSIEAE
jgi:hypothetical protein